MTERLLIILECPNFARLVAARRSDALRAQLIEQAEAEEAAALAEYREQRAAGTVATVPQAEVRRRFGLAAQ
jgi:hypothetical protein